MARRLPSFRWLTVHGACDDQASASSSYLHANLGGTDDWPIKFTGTERHTPELCRLLNELQGEMERGGHRPGRFKFTALTESGNKQILKQATSRTRSSSFSSTTTKCGRGIQADSEARRCRGDEVSKGQHCKSRKEKTLEVRVQVHEAHSTASREPSMTDAAGTFQEGLWNWLRRQNVELLEPPEIGSRTCQSVCAVGRTMSSLTSTSAGCSMANVTARAMASASIAVSVRGLSASAVSASVT